MELVLTMTFQWGEAAAFCRTDDPLLFPESTYPDKLHDSTSGDDSPDLELFSTPLAYKVGFRCALAVASTDIMKRNTVLLHFRCIHLLFMFVSCGQ